jgi:glycosyltransferase involved in cell wall biosynthesis
VLMTRRSRGTRGAFEWRKLVRISRPGGESRGLHARRGPLRIIVSTHTFLPTVGGAELGIHEIYRRVGRAHDVTVLAPNRSPSVSLGVASQDHRPENYAVVLLGAGATGRVRYTVYRCAERVGIPYATALLRLWLRTEGDEIDVVNCHFVKRQALIALVARYVLHVPVVLSLAGTSDVLANLGTLARLNAVLVMKTADRLVANSSYYLAGSKLEGELSVIPYGVDADVFRPGLDRAQTRVRLRYSGDEFVLVAVQRLVGWKRVDILLEVMQALLPVCDDFRLLVVGSGPEEGRLRGLAESLEIGNAVDFVGYVGDDRASLFAAADVFVSHSERETFGIAFAEAMATGIPIVAADLAAAHLLRSECAVVVKPYDVTAFARAVLALRSDPARCKRLGDAGRQVVSEEFDWDRVAGSYRALLESVSAR